MEIINVKELDFNDASNFPPVVYKYRDWAVSCHRTILSERTVFMAPPTSFEDEMDCRLMRRYDLLNTNDNIYNYYLFKSKEDHPGWTRQQHRQFARSWTKHSPLKDSNYVNDTMEKGFRDWDNRFGVLSLTANCSNFDMWNKYSNNGKGFCVGFYSKKLFKLIGGGGPVHYCDVLPEISVYDSFELEHFKQVYTKEKKWEVEEEYRLHIFNLSPLSIKDRQVNVPTDVYCEIIFGWDSCENTRNEIMSSVENQGITVQYYLCCLDNSCITLNEYK